MNCPEELVDDILEIIRIGILNARGVSGHAQRCFNETDHIHNLPDLISDFSLEKLRYYLEVEQPIYLERQPDARRFQPHWDKLSEYLEHQTVQ